MRLCHWFMRELKNATNRTVKKGFLECWAQLGVKLLNLSSELVQNKWELKQEGRISLSLSFSHPYFFHLRLIKEEQSLHLCPPSSHTLLMHHYEALASPHSHPFPGLSGLCCSSVDTLLLSFPARCTPTLVFFFLLMCSLTFCPCLLPLLLPGVFDVTAQAAVSITGEVLQIR